MLFHRHLFAAFGAIAIGTCPAQGDPALVREGHLGEYDRADRTSIAAAPDDKIYLSASVHMPGEENPLAKVYLWSSANAGESWSSGTKVSDSQFEEVAPGLCVTQTGTLLVNYSTSLKWALTSSIENPAHLAWWKKVKDMSLGEANKAVNFWMRRSADGGQTWSEPIALPCSPINGAEPLSDGSLFIFGQRSTDSIRQMIAGERNNFILTGAISEDEGLTWKKLKDLAAVEGANLISNSLHESSYAENAQKEIVVMLQRVSPAPTELKQFEIPEADKTKWSFSRKIGSAKTFHLTALKNNRLLLTYVDPAHPKRIASKISEDGGKTWTEAGMIVSGENAIRDGLSSAQLNDGSIATAWLEDLPNGNARLRYKVWKF